MTSHGMPARPREPANQRVFSCHVTSIVQGRETSNGQRYRQTGKLQENVVLPFMVHTEPFIHFVDMHHPTPCITPLGLE